MQYCFSGKKDSTDDYFRANIAPQLRPRSNIKRDESKYETNGKVVLLGKDPVDADIGNLPYASNDVTATEFVEHIDNQNNHVALRVSMTMS